MDHDSDAFGREEMTIRQETGAPPFCSQALIWTTSPVDQRARALAVRTADALKAAAAEGVAILGPAEAPVRKVNNRYRWMVLLRAPAMAPIRRLLSRVLDPPEFPVPAKDRITVDVDPYNLL
jgi:primosomal protein N' (replication factor Y)